MSPYNNLLFFSILAPIFYVGTIGAADCEWVETTGEVVVENITPEEARQTALNRARNKAIEKVSAIKVSGNTLIKDYSLITDFIKIASSGYILKEEVLNWESSLYQERPDLPPVTLYRVKMKNCVKGELSGDPYFRVKGELNRSVFMHGEEAEIKVACTKDCYLTILNLTAENKIMVLLPNEYEPLRHIKHGEEYNFPIKGMTLEMQILPGHKRDAEAFILIATKERFDHHLLPLLSLSKVQKKGIEPALSKVEGGRSGREIKTEEFYKILLTIPADSRTEEILLYEVREKN